MASDENAGHDRFATVTIEEKPDTRQNRDHDPEKIPESEVQVQNNADGSPPVTSPPQHVDEADNSMPWPKLLLIAAGLWSGVFLHALVRLSNMSGRIVRKKARYSRYLLGRRCAELDLGPDHRGQCNPQHYRRIPLVVRRGLVRERYVNPALTN